MSRLGVTTIFIIIILPLGSPLYSHFSVHVYMYYCCCKKES